MTATNQPPPAVDRSARRRGNGPWLASALLLTFAPKCLMCVAAYVAAGTALRLGSPEICGASSSTAGHWLAWLPVLGLAIGAAGLLVRSRRHGA